MKEFITKNIYILNREFETIRVVDDYSSFIWTKFYRGYGECELYMGVSDSILADALIDNYIQFEDDPGYLMIIKSLNIVTDIDQGNMIKISAVGLEFILTQRIVWGLELYKGSINEGIFYLINSNCCSTTNKLRQFSNPALGIDVKVDPKIKAIKIDTQFTGTNIYDMVMDLCNEYDIGFDIRFEENPTMFVFRLYLGKDRSYEQDENTYVVFSIDYDNLVSSNYTETEIEYKNEALIGGEGEGINRRYINASKGTEQSSYKRYEMFVDARDISSEVDGGTLTNSQYLSILRERGTNKLNEQNKKTEFDSEILPDVSFKYGIDYFLGDIVQIENEYGMKHRSIIDSVIFADDSSNGTTTIPTFRSLDKKEE